MTERRMVVAQADCPARRVPDGTPLTIPEGTFVTITQALGGNYTLTYHGQMVRVDGSDAHLLGLESDVIQFPARHRCADPRGSGMASLGQCL